MHSEWKTLKYHNCIYEKYEINKNGVVRNALTLRVLKNTLNSSGKSIYYYINIWDDKTNKQKNIIIHIAVLETFGENPNNYRYVNFKDKDRTNIKFDNLEWSKYHSNVNDDERILKRKKQNVVNVSNRRKKLKIMVLEHMGGKCQICGYDKCISALEFHHLNPNEKDFSISESGTTRSFEKIKIELDKCICVCSNCHKEIHAGLIQQNEISNLKLNGYKVS